MSEDLILEVVQLQSQLADANTALQRLASQNDGLQVQLSIAQAEASKVPALAARVAELERLLAPPQPGTGVLTVNYSDGRIKYAAGDGAKYSMPSDAARRNQVLALMKIGLGEAQAELMLQHGDDALKALTS